MPGLPLVVTGFAQRSDCERLALAIRNTLVWLSEAIDLTGLDGVTAAVDYERALREIDRGFPGSIPLAPTNSSVIGIGVGMAPLVLRDGVVKTHIVLNAQFVVHLVDQALPEHSRAVHILAHECGHVEGNSLFEQGFPGMLGKRAPANIHEDLRIRVVLNCWNEFAATAMSAQIGEDPTSRYEQTLIRLPERAWTETRCCIEAYRAHADHGRVMREVHNAFGDLMKHASYLLGTLKGSGRDWRDLPALVSAVGGTWFEAYLDRLSGLLDGLWERRGVWADFDGFWSIANIADELMNQAGVYVEAIDDPGAIFVRVP